MVPKHPHDHGTPTTATTAARSCCAVLSPAVGSSSAMAAARGWGPSSCLAASAGSLSSPPPPMRGGSSAWHRHRHRHVLAAATTARTGSSSSSSLFGSASSLTQEQRPHDGHSLLIHNVQTVGPTVLLLGIATAVLFRSVLRHPHSSLSRQSVTYMLLLALQVAVQPKLSQWTVLRSDDKVTVALMEEVVKTSLAAILWRSQGVAARALSLSNWSLPSSLIVAGLPAALYAVQGVLTYTGLQRLDAVTFNGLSQLKTVSAAVFCYLLLGTTQSPQQLAAIALLLISSLLFQRQQQQPPATKPTSKAAPASRRTWSTVRFSFNVESLTGVSACLLATAISGLAGALSQRGLQRAVHAGAGARQHGGGRDPFLYCGEVSLYSALCLLATSLVKSWTGGGAERRPNSDREPDAPGSAAGKSATAASGRSVRWALWIPVTVKAMGGIVTVLVHKHAGSVPKGFALVLGLVLSGMLEPDSLSIPKLAGTALVLLSSWMHFTSSSS